MSFSPDWKDDPEAADFLELRRATVGRTAARHTPWVRETPPGPPLELTGPLTGQPTEYRVLKKELEDGMALPGDPSTTIAHRSGFAWSQHAFEGGHGKTEKS